MGQRDVAQCQVLRCSEPVHRVINVTEGSGRLRLDAIVCYEHSEAIDRGDRWMWRHGERVADVSQPASLLMGDDLPPLVSSFSIEQGHHSSEGDSHLLKVELTYGDGSKADLELELSREDGFIFGPLADE